ncbi:protein kinase [Verrucomicrobiaceae bacterium 227]
MDENVQHCPVCGTPLPMELCPRCTLGALAGDRPVGDGAGGPAIPGLTVHEEVGEGGFGIVYRATQADLIHRSVALKVLKPGVDTRQVLRRFEVERQALALLEHPHIARFYQAGETQDGYPWFTMEFIEGEPISDALAARDLETLIETLLTVCGALSYAHRKGVIHRDLKPSNILVTSQGVAKVIDFGVAKATGPTPGMTLYTADEVTVGTPAYMAPETGGEIDVRSDVYALGAILFELLTGTQPPGSGKFPAPSSLAVRRVSTSLDAIVARAVDPDPGSRYQSVPELAADLRRFQNGESIRVRRKMTRRSWFAATALPLVGGGVFFALRGDPPAEVTPAQMVRLQSSGHPAHIALSPDGTRALAVFRTNGRAILFDPRDGEELGSVPGPPYGIGFGNFDEGGGRFLLGHSNGSFRFYSCDDAHPVSPAVVCASGGDWVVNIRHLTLDGSDDAAVLTLVGKSLKAWTEEGRELWSLPLVGSPYRFAVSPDRTTALVGSPKGRLNFIDLTTATKRLLTRNSAHIYEIKYSPDGSRFACASYDHTACVWDSAGEFQWQLKHGGEVKDLDFSPDGKLLATPSFDGAVRVWDLANGEEVNRFHHLAEVLSVCFTPDGRYLASGGRDDQLRVWDMVSGKAAVEPIDCAGGVDRIRFAKRKDGSLNALVQTWSSELLVIPLPELGR